MDQMKRVAVARGLHVDTFYKNQCEVAHKRKQDCQRTRFVENNQGSFSCSLESQAVFGGLCVGQSSL
jgi:hypothetical protein